MTEDLVSAVRSGDRRVALEALRDVLALSVTSVEAALRAPLARQLRGVLEELASLPVAEESSVVNDLAARRAVRRAKASG